ncbi:unnamed protein product, partial [Amoebophrya sp. A25]|eukprot:GSA25T00001769001.1
MTTSAEAAWDASMIALFSIYGSLLRISLTQVFQFDGETAATGGSVGVEKYMINSFVSNVLGCFCMGLLCRVRTEPKGSDAKVRGIPPQNQAGSTVAHTKQFTRGANQSLPDEEDAMKAEEVANAGELLVHTKNTDKSRMEVESSAQNHIAIPSSTFQHTKVLLETFVRQNVAHLKTGFCGSLTTYSAFNLELAKSLRLSRRLENGEPTSERAVDYSGRGPALSVVLFGSLTGSFVAFVIAYYVLGKTKTKGQKQGVIAPEAESIVELTKSKTREGGVTLINMTSVDGGASEDKENILNSSGVAKSRNVGRSHDVRSQGPFIMFPAILGIFFCILHVLLFWFAFSGEETAHSGAAWTWLSVLAATVIAAPSGASLRWFICRRFVSLTGWTKSCGTLIANVLSCAVICFLTATKHQDIWLTKIVPAGFCGCLSTMSAFVEDIFLVSPHPCLYMLSTMFLCLATNFHTIWG